MNAARSIAAAGLVMLFPPAVSAGEWGLDEMVRQQGGATRYVAKPIDPALVNPWPAELEAEFQQRAHAIITAQTRGMKAGVNTYFENEKRSYGYLMACVLGGDEAKGLESSTRVRLFARHGAKGCWW